MIPTKTAQRLAAVLAVPALLLVSACGSDDGGSDNSGGSGGEATTVVSGELGAKPEIEVDAEAEYPEEPRVTVLSEGDGEEVAEGDYVRTDLVGVTASDQAEQINTWTDPTAPAPGAEDGEEAEETEDAPRAQYVARVGEDGMMPAAILDGVVGQPVGSRVLVEGQVGTIIGPQVVQMGMEEEDGIVLVIDIVGASSTDPAGEVEGEQAEPAEGMPEVTFGDEGPEIAVPEGEDPPAERQEQVLIEGDGPEITAGDGVIVQYSGVKWEDGELFDSSWQRGEGTAFQIGVGAVVQGWDEALTGKNVGDRVLVAIPPNEGYGAAEGHELQDSTLVFVVDLLGAV
ncbi:FKBP-type peptidyl-prolyl cis-trans isomerase [Streptomyces spiramenti]|uniref:peptidylprolyl isomerase n=1 Tax=Streptomyces spiramenti TaxID=2720606 RepID=A0ABX1AFX4_9ACTN|nr:FKBP-type peptidyl-prolyl cis-trans isomerase [Streptomyces spiramenti]NJP66053.1 FKBP-type peptidyl-prolyl cis-trans isomerase [Streptomyces spiramenti]